MHAVRWSRWSATTSTSSRARSTSSRPGRAASRSLSPSSRRWPSVWPRRRSSRSPTHGGDARSAPCSRTPSRCSSARIARDPGRSCGSPPRSSVMSAASVKIQRLADEGVRPRDAAAKLKMHPFVAEKAFAQAANFSADELSVGCRSARGARRCGEGRLAAAGRAGARPRARRRHPPGELVLLAARSRAACALRRAAVFLCSLPRDAALSSQLTSSRCRSTTAVASPPSEASLRRRMSVFAVERHRRFSRRCLEAWRTRFSCCLMFGTARER